MKERGTWPLGQSPLEPGPLGGRGPGTLACQGERCWREGLGRIKSGRVGIFEVKGEPCPGGSTGQSRFWCAVPLCTITPCAPHHLHTHSHIQIPMETPLLLNPHPHRIILEPEVPPLLVVVLLGDASIKHPPAPLVDEVAEGDKGDLVECHLHQKIDVLLCQGKVAWSPDVCLPPATSQWLSHDGCAVGGEGRSGLCAFLGLATCLLGWYGSSILPAHPAGGLLIPHCSVPTSAYEPSSPLSQPPKLTAPS